MRNIYLKFFNFVAAMLKVCASIAVLVLYVHYFFPQSWGFYTVESKVPLYDIYPVHNGRADKKSLIINNMSFGMGVSMKGNILYTELYNILSNKTLLWQSFNRDSLDYILKKEKYVVITPGSGSIVFRGNFIITKTERPSYNMLKSNKPFQLSEQCILANIR